MCVLHELGCLAKLAQSNWLDCERVERPVSIIHWKYNAKSYLQEIPPHAKISTACFKADLHLRKP